MKNLLTIAALTLLTSTAWANNAEGDIYTGEGVHRNIEHSHLVQSANIKGDTYTGEGPNLSQTANNQFNAGQPMHKHPIHKQSATMMNQQGGK